MIDFFRAIYKVAFLRGLSDEEAEDIMQEISDICAVDQRDQNGTWSYMYVPLRFRVISPMWCCVYSKGYNYMHSLLLHLVQFIIIPWLQFFSPNKETNHKFYQNLWTVSTGTLGGFNKCAVKLCVYQEDLRTNAQHNWVMPFHTRIGQTNCAP
jgi:hypothetical protein